MLSPTGQVTRPGRDSPDVNVTLTATITLNGMQTTKTFERDGSLACAAVADRRV